MKINERKQGEDNKISHTKEGLQSNKLRVNGNYKSFTDQEMCEP